MQNNKDSFTLIELALVVGIVVVLAAAVVPIIRESTEKAKTVEVLGLVDTLKSACQRYYFDTGRYARESSEVRYSNNLIYHELSMDNNSPNWNGPYISAQISSYDGPYGGDIIVVNRFLTIWAFNLDGIGAVDRQGNGNLVYFKGLVENAYRIPENDVRKINDKIDVGIPGDWKKTGKVEHLDERYLSIYLIGGTGR